MEIGILKGVGVRPKDHPAQGIKNKTGGWVKWILRMVKVGLGKENNRLTQDILHDFGLVEWR
jgi:hypothetical protein